MNRFSYFFYHIQVHGHDGAYVSPACFEIATSEHEYHYVASGPNLLNLKEIFVTHRANQYCFKIQHVKKDFNNFKNHWQHNFSFYCIPLQG